MYQPASFSNDDPSSLQALMRAHPLGTWVTLGDGGITANHVPFLFEPSMGPQGTLLAHVARANPVWQSAGPSLVVFHGPQAYVSPNWYPSKAAHGKVVPTWNYAVVHVHGRARAVEDRDQLLALVSRLTREHEAGEPAPWQVADAPRDYIDQLLGAIVGIEIEVERIEGKWKMSQNRPADDRAGMAVGLRRAGGDEAAAVAALVSR